MTTLDTMITDLFNTFMSASWANFFATVVIVIMWIAIGFVSVKLINGILRSLLKIGKKDKQTRTINKLLRSVVKFVVWFCVIMIILSNIGVNIAPILASAGIVGVAVGFGAQSIVKDFITGFFIVLEKTFSLDDVIEVNGFKGKVIAMSLRTTRIENWIGQVKIINNGDIKEVINFSEKNSIAVIDFGVAYGTDLLHLNKLMPAFLEGLKEKYEMILEVPQFLGVTNLAESSINLRIIAKTPANEHFQIERDIRLEIVEFFKKNNIEIPFPQLTIHNGK